MNTENQESFWKVGLRVVILYGLILLGVAELLHLDAKSGVGVEQFDESSLTEYMQEGWLFLMVLIFLASAWLNKNEKALTTMLAGAAAMAFIREFDSVLDDYVFDGAWQALALITLLVTAYLVYKKKDEFVVSANAYVTSRSFGFLMAGFLIVFTFSRMFGRTIFWEAIMEENYVRQVKNAAEEGIELLGYTIMVLGAAEYFVYCRKLAKRQAHNQ